MIFIIILFIFLLIAVYSDGRFGKIYNRQIIVGIVLGIGFRYYESGPPGIFSGLCSLMIPLLLLFPFFRIGTLGGGDIKLLATVAVFLTPAQTFLFMGVAFLTAQVFRLVDAIERPARRPRRRRAAAYY